MENNKELEIEVVSFERDDVLEVSFKPYFPPGSVTPIFGDLGD